jgi:hypothetical protein
MANHPSQPCLCCEGKGGTGWPVKVCALCKGNGKVTIRVARAIGWRPIRHRKRAPRPRTMEMFAGGA